MTRESKLGLGCRARSTRAVGRSSDATAASRPRYLSKLLMWIGALPDRPSRMLRVTFHSTPARAPTPHDSSVPLLEKLAGSMEKESYFSS